MPKPISVTLTPMEMIIAGQVGVSRSVTSIKNCAQDLNGIRDEERYGTDIIGAFGEIAFCKALNIYWAATVKNFHGSDVGANIQIRTSYFKSNRLIVRDKDKNTDVFVLVIGQENKFNIIGWMMGSEAKNKKWLSDPTVAANRIPAYFVPQSELHSMDEFGKRKSAVDIYKKDISKSSAVI